MPDTPPPANGHLEEDINAFFKTIKLLGALAREISQFLPSPHPFHSLYRDVVDRLPLSMDAVSDSIVAFQDSTPVLLDTKDDEHRQEEGEKSTNDDHADLQTPLDAAGSSLRKPTPPPNDSNARKVLSDGSTTYRGSRLVPPTPPPHPSPPRLNPVPSNPFAVAGPPTDMSHLSEVAQGKRRVALERADAFLETCQPNIFWDTQKHGCKDKFLFDQAKVPQELTSSLQECIRRERERTRSIVAARAASHNVNTSSASARPFASGPSSRAASATFPPDSTPDTSTAAPTSTHNDAARASKSVGKGKKRAREEDEQLGSVPTGASDIDPGTAPTSDDIADKRPTRKAKTTKAPALKASSSRKISRVSKFFRGEDVSPSSAPQSEPSRPRFVAEEQGPKATYNGRPVVMIMSKYRSRSVEIPEDFTPEAPEEVPAAPAPVKPAKGKGKGKKRAREQEEVNATTTESALAHPQLEGTSPPKKPRRGRAQAQAGSQPEAGLSGSGPSNPVTSEVTPVTKPEPVVPVGVTPARPTLRRSTRQAKIAAANGK